jgi:hypothetical protein
MTTTQVSLHFLVEFSHLVRGGYLRDPLRFLSGGGQLHIQRCIPCSRMQISSGD